MPTQILALAGGSYVFLAAILIFFAAVIYGYFTIRGSGINKHPDDGRGGAPGAEGPSEASGQGRATGNSDDNHKVGDSFSSHGTG